MEVRVGMAAVDSPGDFSSYDLFGTFPGPATELDREIKTEVLTLSQLGSSQISRSVIWKFINITL